MFGLCIFRPIHFIPLLTHILLFFSLSCESTQDITTEFSSKSSEENTYESSSNSTSIITTYQESGSWNSASDRPQKKSNWCGKSSSVISNGAGSTANLLTKPLLNLQCATKLKPYIETDDAELGGFIVDASLTYYPVKGAIEISERVKQLQIVFINTNTSRAVTAGIVEVNTVGNVFEFPITSLGEPSLNSYHVLCQAYSKEEYLTEKSISVAYLPNKDGKEQAVRINAESGTMSVQNQNGVLETLIPFGFAIDYNQVYLPSQLIYVINYLQELKVNTIQLILSPQSINDLSRLDHVFHSLGEAGFWVQYDMRNIYWNKDLVIAHLKVAKRHPNFLLYHTAMEPDGQDIKLDILRETHQVIEPNDLYHPISLTLSCEDYYFSNYTDGNDVVLTNPFVIGMSKEQDYSDNRVSYNSVYGSSACDGCKGSFVDLVNRIRIFRHRRHLSGRDRTMQIWAVPQAVGAQSDSNQVPTGEQFLLMSTIYIIEGVVGLMTWNDRMNLSSDLKRAIETVGKFLPLIGKYLERPQSFLPLPPVNSYPNDKFIANIWFNQNDHSMLLMVANLAAEEVSWEIDPHYPDSSLTTTLQTSWLYVSKNCSIPQLIHGQGKISFKSKLQGYGFGAWIVRPDSPGNSSFESVGDLNQLFTV